MPEDPNEYLLCFGGFSGRPSYCHLFVAREGVVLGELKDNKGTSVTNALELVCAGIAVRFFDGSSKFEVFEWLPEDAFTEQGRMLEIRWHAQGLRLPEWRPVLKLPPYAEAAESKIRQQAPYTRRALSRRGIELIALDNAHAALEAIRRELPPLPPTPDRPPRPRPPELTRLQREILVSLARPLAGPDPSARPASTAEIATALSIPVALVNTELKDLHEKLQPPARRRERLVEEAIKRGIITRTDLLSHP